MPMFSAVAFHETSQIRSAGVYKSISCTYGVLGDSGVFHNLLNAAQIQFTLGEKPPKQQI